MQRKKYTPEFKAQAVKEAMETGNTSIVARRYELNSNMVCRWVREIKKQEQAQISVSTSSAEVKQIKSENEQLKKLVGEKELENQILRDLLKKTNPHSLTKLK